MKNECFKLFGVNYGSTDTQAKLIDNALAKYDEHSSTQDINSKLELSTSQKNYLQELLLKQECRNIPLVTGQQVPVSINNKLFYLRVGTTEPRYEAVLVGPTTSIQFNIIKD